MERKMKTMDGNTACAYVSYAYTECAAIYPITPSSTMAEITDQWANEGKKNIFGETVKIVEMQSEAGAAGALHGSLLAGALTTTYTASQGLLLMIPNMYKLAGEMLPGVIHVSARALATHALSIFGDHSDIYAVRQTGFALLCSSNIQEIMDLAPIAHCCSVEGRIPFLHFFDGFRTSHEIQKIEVWDYETLEDLLNKSALIQYKEEALNPEKPSLRGSSHTPDIFFQAREASNSYYERLPDCVHQYMTKINELIGTDYDLFNYYGCSDAKKIIIAMGSICDTIEETVDYLNETGEKTGVIKIRLFRPFSVEHFISKIPESVEQIYVIDRTKEPGSLGEPLYEDVVVALSKSKFKDVEVYNGRYGLGSKDTNSAHIISIFKNNHKKTFTVGIIDDVTDLSLEINEKDLVVQKDIVNCKFWGLGSDGTVGANKNSIKIIGDNTDLFVQAYFDYDSKKSGGITISHLRFGKDKIRSAYLINSADFVACHNQSYIGKYSMVEELRDGGTFLLNCEYSTDNIEEILPNRLKRYMADHNINFYIIDGVKIAREIGLGGRINTILQAAFFKLANIIPVQDAIKFMKEAAYKSYINKGEKIVNMNYQAIDRGVEGSVRVQVKDEWSNLENDIIVEEKIVCSDDKLEKFINNIQVPMNKQLGNQIPVSAFSEFIDGKVPQGTSAFEKRGIALEVPNWIKENCIQCNFCSYVCPHAVIRPAVFSNDDSEELLINRTLDMTGVDNKQFAITISNLDCTSCGACINICPGKKGNKALDFVNITEVKWQQDLFDYGQRVGESKEAIGKFKTSTVKGSQFKKPLLEFSGACAGCGETAYAKLVTQLFGDKMFVANATGCSSIWGGSLPSTPYTTNDCGKGPAWANSLFEDNAEFGYGMQLAYNTQRERMKNIVSDLVLEKENEVVEQCKNYLDTFDDLNANQDATKELINALSDTELKDKTIENIIENKQFLSKKSQWIFGGDGWAYDIGFGGLDHVLASGANVNVLVFDTEVYSNTGGQSSKSTPIGAVAKFATGGKTVYKKDLAGIAMSYGYVYVAQISQGADFNQCIKAINEAEQYNGPSLIIAYAPCIAHGIKGGLQYTQLTQKKAVLSGYWNLFRYNPSLKEEGNNPFILDSKEPSIDFKDFLLDEIRFSNLYSKDKEKAERLFELANIRAVEKYNKLKKMSLE